MTEMNASQARLYFRLQIAAHLLKKRADGLLLDEASITAAQAAVLVLVAEREPVSQREIARTLGQNDSAMTAMVRRLDALGYVTRERSAEDERRRELCVTKGGRAALGRIGPAFTGLNAAIDGALSPADIGAMAEGLDAIVAALKAQRG